MASPRENSAKSSRGKACKADRKAVLQNGSGKALRNTFPSENVASNLKFGESGRRIGANSVLWLSALRFTVVATQGQAFETEELGCLGGVVRRMLRWLRNMTAGRTTEP
jgi:hypothetical protein